MQRRHAIIAAIALVALVLIPAAALAAGLHGGFGHRGGPGGANATYGISDGAANATHPNWTPGDDSAARPFHGNASCTVNPSHTADIVKRTCDQERLGNRTHALADSRTPGSPSQCRQGIGR